MAGHFIQNTGNGDLVFLELFVAPEFQDISLNNRLLSLLQQAAMAHTKFEKGGSREDSRRREYADPMIAAKAAVLVSLRFDADAYPSIEMWERGRRLLSVWTGT